MPQNKWLYLAILSLVWGSSYILIKKGLESLTPLQLGSLRLLITTISLLPFGYKSLRNLSRYQWKWLAITAYVGTFFPAFFFAFAQQHIDSAIAAILNALTPLLTVVIGVVFFGVSVLRKQYWGVALGLLGSAGLIWGGIQLNPDFRMGYALLILCASACYATNIHFIKIHLQQVGAMAITLGNFVMMAPLALFILLPSGFFDGKLLTDPKVHTSLVYVAVLAILGSAIAKYLFNQFVKFSSAVFASSVTYTLPIVALFWGVADGERISMLQIMATAVILVGVYLSHKKRAA
ncbi:MAG: DMT family transporter [Flavobacteriaceae bacterium]